MNGNNCKSTCWLVALAAGLLVGLFFWFGADWGFFWSLIAGVIVWVLAGVFLPRFFCSDEPAQVNSSGASGASGTTGVSVAPAPKAAPPAEPETASEPEIEPEIEPEPETAPEPEPAANNPVADPSGSMIKTSTELPGQAELAGRKGTWRYQGDASAPSAGKSPVAASVTPAASADEGSQPQGLSAARSGGADNLKLIKGVGPKLEGVLNSLGFFHFDQIADWGASDVAWVDENLLGFKGRVSRDNWVAQAKALAAGEETEFAQRAQKDGIYD